MKIHEYNQMMAYLTRPATPTETPDIRQPAASGGRIGLALGTERETTDNTQFASLEDSTMGPDGYPMTAGRLDLLNPKTYTQGYGTLKKAADKYGVKLEDWLSKTKKEKDAILYEYNKNTLPRDLDSYVAVPDKLLTRIEPSKKTLAKTDEELIAELRLRRNMNTPEYWTNLEALSKNTGKSVSKLELELAPEGGKIFSFAEKLTARFDKDTIEKMFPSAKNLSRAKEYAKIFKVNNKKPINFGAKGSDSLNYQTSPDLFEKRIELIKNKNFDMDALYTQIELKEIFNSPNFDLRYVGSVLPDAVKRIGPMVAKKGTPGGVKQGLTSINDVINAFKTKTSTPTILPRAIGFAGRKAQQEIDEGLFKMTGTSFRKVLSRKIKENSKTKQIEAFTAGGKIDQNITSILQKYDVKVPEIAHLNPVEFAKREILSETKNPTKSLDSLLGNPRFPGFTKNIDKLYTTENLGFQGPFFNSNVLGRQIQKELKDVYKNMQPIILKYQNKKVPLAIQREIEKLNGQANRLLKKSRDAQSTFKQEMTGAAKNFEDLYSGTLGKTGPYGEVRLAESMGKNELKVINLNKTKGSPFIINKSKGALNVDAKNWSDLSDTSKVKAKQSWFNNFKTKMLTQIPDASEKKVIEKYLDLYVSPLEKRVGNIDPITGKSIAKTNEPRRTDTSYNEGGRVGLAEGSEDLPAETLPAIAAGAYRVGKPIVKGGLKAAGSVTSGLAFATTSFIKHFNQSTADTEEGKVYDALTKSYNIGDSEKGLGSEVGIDLLLPEIAKQFGKNVTSKGALAALGRFALNPIGRAATIMTPAGLTLNAAAVAKQYYDFAKDEIGKVEQMTPENKKAYNNMLMDETFSSDASDYYSSQDVLNDQDMDIKDVIQEYNNGGRVGYADGPKDPKRRTVIKGLTALAALPIIGKYFKLVKSPKAAAAVETVMEKVSGMPDWFQPFVNKVLKMGDDVTDTAATTEREIVKRIDIEDATVDVHYNTATNDVRVEVVGGKNALNEPLEMQYKAPEVIEETGKKTKGEFSAVESKPQAVQIGPDDYDIEAGENVTNILDDLLSETDYLEGFATGKIRTPSQIKKAKNRTFHRENMKDDPGQYILEEDMGNFSSPDRKNYETITSLDEIEDLLTITKKKK